jgi:hypothetical protein
MKASSVPEIRDFDMAIRKRCTIQELRRKRSPDSESEGLALL